LKLRLMTIQERLSSPGIGGIAFLLTLMQHL
jgi:hypothetical protein